MELLLMNREHLDGVEALERLCFVEPWSAKALALLIGDGAFAFVCTEGDDVIAYGGMLTVLDEGQVTNIAVHPDHRRCGLGKRIVSEMLDEGIRRGLNEISLEVRASNIAAVRLYEQNGFVCAGIRRNFYKQPTEDALVMIRTLTSSDGEKTFERIGAGN